MEKQNSSGFREVEHTADWALEAWAPSLEELFSQAAQGMIQLMGICLQDGPGVSQQLDITGDDLESQFVSLLSELLYRVETQRTAFDRIILQCGGPSLRAQYAEKPIIGQSRWIKAVTYHDLAIRHEQGRWKVKIVFDV